MRLLVTGATGFLGWRSTVLLRARGHEVVSLARPHGAPRALAADVGAVRMDAGDPGARGLLERRDAVLHFAGVPHPADDLADPARAVRENAGTTLNLLEGCLEHGAGLVYPSSIRAAIDPPPDAYALSKRLGEDLCRLHRARATAVRLSSVFGPGQLAHEGATGAIANFAARALAGKPIVIYGNPRRTRDFLFVDDVVAALEAIVAEGRWNETITFGSGEPVALLEAAELVREAAASSSSIETPWGTLPRGEDESYEAPSASRLGFPVRPFREAVRLYVDWLRSHTASQSGA